MKLIRPQDLVRDGFSVGWIRDHAESIGFVKIGKKWVASEEMIKSALECSTSEETLDFDIANTRFAGRSYSEPLEELIEKMQKKFKKNSGRFEG